MNNLGRCHLARKRPDKAVPVFEEAWEIAKANLPADHPRRARIADNLAQAYQADGRPAKAVPLLEETLRLTKDQLGTNDLETVRREYLLADAYQASGRPDLALPHFQAAAAGMEGRGFQHPNARGVVLGLVGCLKQLGKSDEVRVWEQKWLAATKQRLDPAEPGPPPREIKP
jgi:tetratricopeptide (TPR) repeat protein